MEVDEIQAQGCKFPRIGNSRSNSIKIGQKGDMHQYPHEEEEEDGQVSRNGEFGGARGGGGSDFGGSTVVGRLSGWPSSMSRIVRVSRATGGKDRHSKVLTSKGLRDRRVRLSVATAIQFYDLQDRLGYDQPSKAVEWLLKAAARSIDELPSLNSSFPDTPKQLSDEKRSVDHHGFDSVEVEMDGDLNYHQQNQNLSLSKSTCSSTSETSKGSGLSLSRSERSENRVKARERARGRAAEKEKEKGIEAPNVNHLSQNSSFTELLTGGISSVNNNNTTSANGSSHHQNTGGESNLFHKLPREWSSAPMDYFATGLLGSSSRTQQSSGFSGQTHLGNSLPQPSTVSMFNVNGDHHHHQELQHFSFVPDHLVPTTVTAAGGSDYNLNFSISSSSGLAGTFNRGTLQSNSPSLLPHQLQRFSPIDGSNIPFFMGTTTAPPNAAPVENHHHFLPGFDGRLQLFYGDGNHHPDQKGKEKNRV